MVRTRGLSQLFLLTQSENTEFHTYYTIESDTYVTGAFNIGGHTDENTIWNTSHYPDVKPSQFSVMLDTGMSFLMLPARLLLDDYRTVARSKGGYRS